MLDFIVNPKAGTIKGKKLKKVMRKLEERLIEKNVPYTIHKTNYKGHGKVLTENLITAGATDIIAIGGDGTLHEILNGFHSFDKCNLGLIPCGTGNDFAGICGLSKDPIEALEIILKNEPKFTDYMQLPTARGMNVAGTGLDVSVLQRYEKLKRKTKFAYTMCLIKTVFNFKGVEFDIEANGETKHFHSFIAGVCNGDRFGGGIKICPAAQLDDGKINFVGVNHVKGIFAIIKEFLMLKKGKILESPNATAIVSDKIKVITKDPAIVNLDGELYEGIPFEVEVVSNTLKMHR